MLDVSQLRVNDRVRLRRPVSSHDPGAVGTVVKTLTAHEPDGKEVPAVVVAWDLPRARRAKQAKQAREVFTQHEQALHRILERAEQTDLPQRERGLW